MAAIRLQSRQRLKKLFVYCRPPENAKLTPSEGQLKMTRIINAAREHNLPIQFCSKREIDEMAADRPHQNVILEASTVKLPKALKVPEKGKHVLLHNVRDPQNLGTILRTALLMSMDSVLLAGECSILTPVVAKASSGALEEYLAKRTLLSVGSLVDFFGDNRPASFPIIAAVCQDGCLPPPTPSPNGLLLIGSEGRGLSESLISRASHKVTLPMARSEHVDSFNISVATALLINKVFSA